MRAGRLSRTVKLGAKRIEVFCLPEKELNLKDLEQFAEYCENILKKKKWYPH